MFLLNFTIMQTIYKSVFISLLVISANNVVAHEFDHGNDEVIVEPRLQATFFPGLKKSKGNGLVMNMVDPSGLNDDLLRLNSSLVKPNNDFEKIKTFDDIEVTNNNLFELKF